MKINNTLTSAGYQSPICTCMGISSEGILCASFGNEDYDSLDHYGDLESPNKGWE